MISKGHNSLPGEGGDIWALRNMGLGRKGVHMAPSMEQCSHMVLRNDGANDVHTRPFGLLEDIENQ